MYINPYELHPDLTTFNWRNDCDIIIRIMSFMVLVTFLPLVLSLALHTSDPAICMSQALYTGGTTTCMSLTLYDSGAATHMSLALLHVWP